MFDVYDKVMSVMYGPYYPAQPCKIDACGCMWPVSPFFWFS